MRCTMSILHLLLLCTHSTSQNSALPNERSESMKIHYSHHAHYPINLEMNCLAISAHGSLLECFRQCRMGMTCSCDVLAAGAIL